MRFARFLTVALLSAALVAGLHRRQRRLDLRPGAVGHPTAEQCRLRRSERPRRIGATRTWSQISALNIKFEQTTVTAPADTPFQVQFENKDPGTLHDVALRLGDVNGAELFKGEIFTGVATRVYDVPALDAGAYAFVCTVHPTMIGTLNAE